jgi:hypothetical protein
VRLATRTRERYEISCNMLLHSGFIEKVKPFRMTEKGPQADDKQEIAVCEGVQ